jgi:hypothetical protein
MLRRGNHASAKFWRRLLLPVIERYRDRGIPKYFRGDSAFALPNLLRLLEKEGFRYAIRLKSKPVLQRKIGHLLKHPVGRPSRKPKKFYASFRYREGSWEQARRVVAKVAWHAGELFPRVGFIVTNLKWCCKRVVRFYYPRDKAGQWIKEGKNAVKWTKLSCRRFKDHEARLQLFALAYGIAQANPELDAEHAAREVGQDWGLGGVAGQVRRVPVGGGSSAPSGVRGDCETNRPAAAGVCFGVRLAVRDKNGLHVVAGRSEYAERVKFGG